MAVLLARWNAAAPRVRLTMLAILAVLALGIGGSLLATRDTRVVLFSAPLKPDQLAEVEERLAAWTIPFAPSPDNVRVDARRRSELLLRLSLAGVPHVHLATSDETLAKIGALTPQSVVEAQTRDGLAADLAVGLRGIAGIADARIVIAPARAGMYADERSHDASASVRITLAPGARLAANVVLGIRRFVAGGVPGLEPERVTVLDDRGLALGESTDAHDDEATQLALQSALDAAFGAGATIVRVHRELAGVRRDVRDVRRALLPGGAIAVTTNDERYASDRKKYSRSHGTEDRGSDTRETNEETMPTTTARVTIAVFVDSARDLDINKIRDLAAATSGIDRSRGDAVTVAAVRFAAPVPPLPVRVPSALTRYAFSLAPQIIVAFAIVATLGFGTRPAYRLAERVLDRASIAVARERVSGIAPTHVRGALLGEPPHTAAAIISALPAATATAVLELYPPEERAAIVRRLTRSANPLLPDTEELFRAR